MSTPQSSASPSLPWFKLLVITFSLGLIITFGVAALISAGGLSQSLPLTADKAYWFISRTSGILAYLLLTLSVLWGLVQSGAILRPTIPPLLALGLHSFLSWAGLAMVAVHGLILLGDNFIKMTLADILIPFIGPYQPLLVGLGVISFYLSFLLSLSFYIRDRIGQKTFRLFHYVSYPTFLLVTWHSLGAGTDSGLLWPLYILSLLAVLVTTLWRIVSGRQATAARKR